MWKNYLEHLTPSVGSCSILSISDWYPAESLPNNNYCFSLLRSNEYEACTYRNLSNTIIFQIHWFVGMVKMAID